MVVAGFENNRSVDIDATFNISEHNCFLDIYGRNERPVGLFSLDSFDCGGRGTGRGSLRWY